MSSQSKDNTCPTCGKVRNEFCSNIRHFYGSGQQEDKPLTRTEYYEANPPKPEDQLKGIATDSKPEKPHEHQWQTRSNGTFCLGCGGIKLPEDEPSKPDQPHMSDQLRPLLWKLRLNPNQPHIITDTQLAIEALISQREQEAHNRGWTAGHYQAYLEEDHSIVLDKLRSFKKHPQAFYLLGEIERLVEQIKKDKEAKSNG